MPDDPAPPPAHGDLPATPFRSWAFIGRAWRSLGRSDLLLLGGMCLVAIGAYLPFALAGSALGLAEKWLVGSRWAGSPDALRFLVLAEIAKISISLVLGSLVLAPLSVGIWRALLAKADGQKVEFKSIAGGLDRFGPAYLAALLSGTLTYLGFQALVLPGVLLSILWMFTVPLLAETRLGPWAAMKASARLTRGHRWDLFCFTLACACVGLLGVIVCGLGLLVAVPVIGTATALAYRSLQEEKHEAIDCVPAPPRPGWALPVVLAASLTGFTVSGTLIAGTPLALKPRSVYAELMDHEVFLVEHPRYDLDRDAYDDRANALRRLLDRTEPGSDAEARALRMLLLIEHRRGR